MLTGQYFDRWLKSIGRSRTTGFRWEREGKITVRRVYGRKFVTNEEIERFFREGEQHEIRNPAKV